MNHIDVMKQALAALEEVSHTRGPRCKEYLAIAALREALVAQPATIGRDEIRAIFLRNGFVIKEGHADLKEYVYSAADELIKAVQAVPRLEAEAAVNETNAVLASRYFDLLQVVKAYEKSGVTCQTFRNFVTTPCAECNCTSQPAQQEPVAIAECKVVHGAMAQFLNRTRHGMNTLKNGDKLYTQPQPQPKQEPDAIGCRCSVCGEWQRWTPSGMTCKNGHGGAPGVNHRLYTAPQPAQLAARVPLTDEQRMIEMVDSAMVATASIYPPITRSQCETIIRAAAHGITKDAPATYQRIGTIYSNSWPMAASGWGFVPSGMKCGMSGYIFEKPVFVREEK